MRFRLSAVLVTSLALAGCSLDDEAPPPGEGERSEEKPERAEKPGEGRSSGGQEGDEAVIRGWSDALRAGKVDEAVSFFTVPSVVENGTPPIELGSERAVRAFNEALPCGAELKETEKLGRYTVGVFELTERPGAECGQGVGGEARTAFEIEDGKIKEWRRVPDDGSIPPAPGSGPPVTS